MLRYKLALLCVSFIVTFAVAEVWLRAIDTLHTNPIVSVRGPDGLVTYKPNLSVDYYSGEAGRSIRFETDALGFVGRPDTSPQEGTTLIAFMGDSYTAADQIDTNKNFVSLVQKRFSEKPVSFINDGLEGLGTVEEVARYAARVAPLKPAVVVLALYMGNDFDNNAPFLSEKDTLLAMPITKWPKAPPVEIAAGGAVLPSTDFIRPLLLKSRVIRFIREVARNDPSVSAFLVRIGIFKDLAHVDQTLRQILPYIDPYSVDGKKDIDFTAAVVGTLQDFVSKHGGRLVLVLIPAHWQVDPSFVANIKERLPQADVDFPQKELKEKLGARVPIIDLTDPIAQAIKSGRHVYLLDRGHFTEYGHELAASEISTFLEKILPTLK